MAKLVALLAGCLLAIPAHSDPSPPKDVLRMTVKHGSDDLGTVREFIETVDDAEYVYSCSWSKRTAQQREVSPSSYLYKCSADWPSGIPMGTIQFLLKPDKEKGYVSVTALNDTDLPGRRDTPSVMRRLVSDS